MLDRFFNLSLDLLCIADFEGYFQQLNPAWEKTLGFQQEELLNKPYLEFVHPEDREATIAEAKKLETGVETISFENRYLCKDGSYKWLLWKTAPSPNDSLLYAVARDITEQKQAQEVLFLTQKRLQHLLTYSPAIIYTCQAEGDFCHTFVSDNITNLIGYKPEEFLQDPNFWKSHIHPDDLERVIAGISDLFATGSHSHEYRFLFKDGNYRWLYDELKLVRDEASNILEIVGCWQDISDRKAAEIALKENEERWQLALRGANDGIWDWNLQTNEVFFSARWKEMLGYAEHEVENNLNGWSSLVHPDDIKQAIQLVQDHLAKQTNFYVCEHRLLCKDGTYKWILARAQALWDEMGNPVRLIGSHTDISERKQMEEALKRGKEKLEIRVEKRTAQLSHALEKLEAEISERKKVETALRESELRLNSILNSLQDVVWSLSATDFQMLYINSAAEKLYGRPNQDFFDNSQLWLEVIHSQDCDRAIQGHQQLMETGSREIQYRIIRPDGEVRWVHDRAWLIYDENNQPIRLYGITSDITERKAAKEGLRQREEQLRHIIQNMPVMMIAFNDLGNIIIWNRECEQVTGYSGAEMIGNPLAMELIYPDHNYRAKMFKKWAEIGNNYRNWEWDISAKDGKIKTIAWSNISDEFPIPGWELWEIGVDVTERKRAEQALVKSENQFRNLAKKEALINRLSGDIRKSLDLNTILQTTVQEVRNLLLVDRCFFAWYETNEEPTFAIVNEAKINVLGSITGKYQVKTGSLIQKILNLATIRWEDLKNDPDPVKQGIYRNWGVTAMLMVPIQTVSGKIGLLNCSEHGNSRDWSNDEVELLQTVCDQLAIALSQAELYHQAETSALLAREKATELQQTLHKLQQTQTHLIQSEKMSSLGQLVAGIAHEINNPVNFIYGNIIHTNEYIEDLLNLIDLYEEQYPSPVPEIEEKKAEIELDFLLEDLPKILSSMKMGAERIRSIVLSLRNFSRLDEADMKAVDIHEGIENTLLILQNRFKSKANHHNIQVIKNYGKLPLIECYAGQLNQVFMNIINNGIDALESCENHQPIIYIQTELLSTNRVAIRIADNGPGMTETVKNRLFDPFFTTKPVGKGTGLGLSISYQIVVDKHGGVLKCTSELGQGTEFWIEIPISLPKS